MDSTLKSRRARRGVLSLAFVTCSVPTLTGCATGAGLIIGSNYAASEDVLVEVPLGSLHDVKDGERLRLQLDDSESWITLDFVWIDPEEGLMSGYRDGKRSDIPLEQVREMRALRLGKGPFYTERMLAPMLIGMVIDVILYRYWFLPRFVAYG